MKRFWPGVAAGVWALLLALSLAPRLSTITRHASRIFDPVEAKARLESGHPGLHDALASLRGAAGPEKTAMLLWYAGREQHVYILYRASYELFPIRVWFIPLVEPPILNEEINLVRGGTSGGAEFAAVGSHQRPDAWAIYRKTGESGGGVGLKRVDPAPPPAAATRAGRPWMWPVGLASVIAFGMFFSWAGGLNSVFAGARTAWLGFSFLSGAGLVGFSMIWLSMAGIRLDLFSVSAALCAGSAVWLSLRKATGAGWPAPFVPPAGPSEAKGLAWQDKAGIGLIVIGLAVALSRALIPFEAWHNWDAWAIWDFKVKACFEERGIPMDYLGYEPYGFSHRDYPLGLPFLQTYLAFWAGGVGHSLLRLISPVFYLALLFMTADLLRGLGVNKGRWLLSGSLGLIPFVLEQSANGYADLPLSAAMTSCLAISVWALRQGAPLWAVAWSGAVAASIKDEGIVWAVACILVAFWGMRRTITKRRAAAAILLFVALAGPWKTVTLRLGLSSTDRTNDVATIVREAGSRAALIAEGVFLETVGPGLAGGRLWGRPGGGLKEFKAHVLGKWLLFWQGVLVAFLLGSRKFRTGLRPMVFFVLAFQAAAVLAAYLATAHDMGWHLMTSLDRILLQMAPAFMALAASCLPFLKDQGNAGMAR